MKTDNDWEWKYDIEILVLRSGRREMCSLRVNMKTTRAKSQGAECSAREVRKRIANQTGKWRN